MNDNNCNNCKTCEKVLWGGIPVSIVLMVLGLAIIIRPKSAGAETVLVAAIALLIEAVDLVRRGVYMVKSGSDYALMQFAIAILTILAAVLMLVNPFSGIVARARFCGATILILGIMTFAGSLICKGLSENYN